MGNKPFRKRARNDGTTTQFGITLRPSTTTDIKTLILGAGGSGKSTVYRQLVNMCDSEANALFQNAAEHIRDFIGSCISSIIEAQKHCATNVPPLEFELSTLQQPNAQEAVFKFWLSDATQHIFGERFCLHIPENVEYFLSTHAARILSPNARFALFIQFFHPAVESASNNHCSNYQYHVELSDVLRCYFPTTGILQAPMSKFFDSGLSFELYDIGGRRRERKKWIHCFDSVTSIIFCASLVDYDLTLLEDEATNAMTESIALWGEIKNSKWFRHDGMKWIFMFTKLDLFEEKISSAPISGAFPGYTGPNEVEPCLEFIKQQYFAKIDDPNAVVHTHYVCALDENLMQHVFTSMKDYILTTTGTQYGFI